MIKLQGFLADYANYFSKSEDFNWMNKRNNDSEEKQNIRG